MELSYFPLIIPNSEKRIRNIYFIWVKDSYEHTSNKRCLTDYYDFDNWKTCKEWRFDRIEDTQVSFEPLFRVISVLTITQVWETSSAFVQPKSEPSYTGLRILLHRWNLLWFSFIVVPCKPDKVVHHSASCSWIPLPTYRKQCWATTQTVDHWRQLTAAALFDCQPD